MNQLRRDGQSNVQCHRVKEGRHSHPALGQIQVAIRLGPERCEITSPAFLPSSRKAGGRWNKAMRVYICATGKMEPERKMHCNSDEAQASMDVHHVPPRLHPTRRGYPQWPGEGLRAQRVLARSVKDIDMLEGLFSVTRMQIGQRRWLYRCHAMFPQGCMLDPC